MARIMVVDDAMFIRGSLKKILEQAGYQVVAEAGNGQEAITQYQFAHPDMVLMDITMPEMDGITCVREIKKIDPNAKIIMVSAMGQQERVVEAIQAGATDFVVKPFEPSRVVSAIQRWI